MKSRYRLRNRMAEIMARDLLRDRGHTVIRAAGAGSPVDLVAWKEDRSVLFVRAVRARRRYGTVAEISSRFRHEIAVLRRLPRLPYLSVEFWVLSGDDWRIFSVYRNGIQEVERE